MPGFDRTGPEGQGSLTGRGLGKCKGKMEDESEYASRRTGRRLGLGNKNKHGQTESSGRGQNKRHGKGGSGTRRR